MPRLVPLAIVLLACGPALAQRPPGGNPMQHPPHAPFVRPGEGAPAHGPGELGATDRNFIADAARAGLAEIAAATIALQRSRDRALRNYARHLVQDHQAANERLRRIAAAKGVALPARPSGDQQDELRKLQREDAKDFDLRFLRQMVDDHQRLRRIAAAKGVALPARPSGDQQDELRKLQREDAKDFDLRFLRQMVDDHQRAIDLFGHEIKGRHQDAQLKNFAQQTVIGLERHLAEAQRLRKAAGHLPGA